ncbi:MAG TPA: SgcJ/EcaC family oxidoreductase [Candidatus Saccharimonadales bacterium]|nr:SgcJ/EcaC family oxidoreductase [Candidatus Saccharimonadales bacterium]
MRTLILVLLVGTALGGNFSAVQKDGKTIEHLVSRFVTAWNQHDAQALAGIFGEDADFTNVRGRSLRGREAIEQFHAPRFETMFKDSHLTSTEVRTRFTTPTSASVDVLWEMTGAVEEDGNAIPIRRGVANWLVTEHGGKWLISSMRNEEFSPDKECVNQGIDHREFASMVCWLQRAMSWKSDHEPHFFLIGKSEGTNLGLAWPPYLVLNVPDKNRRWRMFRMGFRYDRNWRGYIFPTLAAKSIAHPLRY